MAAIKYRTTITQIRQDEKRTPQGALWAFVNNGTTTVYINKIALEPGDKFGVDASDLLAQAIFKNIPVENETQFDITFLTNAATDSTITRSLQLIETFFILEN